MPDRGQAGSARANTKSPIVILQLEDDDATAKLFAIALRELDSAATLFRVRDVNQAKGILRLSRNLQ